jgi:hypothetical protein
MNVNMADSEQIECDAAIFVVQTGVKIETIIQEVKELLGTLSSTPTQFLCAMVYDSDHSDFHDQLVHELSTAFPSMMKENVVSINTSPQEAILVQRGFAIKCALDSRKISDFVVFSTEDRLSALLVVMDTMLTSAYHMRVKVYNGPYIIDIPAALANTGADTRSAVKKECSKYLAELATNPHEKLEVIKSDLICNKTFVHGFSTRKGGCSFYPSVASLNLAFTAEKRDPVMVVEENRHRLLKSLGAPSHRFEVAKAVHGNTVWVVGTPQLSGYDAIVCDKPGVVVAAPAADCVTIILADERRGVCAAVHSGWKGKYSN